MVRRSMAVLVAVAPICVGAVAGEPDAVAAPADRPAVDVPIEVFTGPRAVDLVQPPYPSNRQYQDREGWVRLNFMVAADGTPYEAVVTDSTGDPEFEEAALLALQRSRFQPAVLDGTAIDAGHALTYQFALRGINDGARPRFAGGYRKLMNALQAGDQEAADDALDQLEVHNLYENAYLQIGRYRYAQRWGSRAQQLAALRRAVGHADDRVYLSPELFEFALSSLFALQLETNRFADALATARRLDDLGLEAGQQAALAGAVAEIRELQADDRAFAVDAEIGAGTSWFHRLLKHRFRIEEVDGRVAEIKLRCDRKYVLFRYDPELTYRIAGGYGFCRLEVVGDPGTAFTLVEL